MTASFILYVFLQTAIPARREKAQDDITPTSSTLSVTGIKQDEQDTNTIINTNTNNHNHYTLTPS